MIEPALAEKIDAMLRVVAPGSDRYIVDMDLLRGLACDDDSCFGWAHRGIFFDLAIRDRMGELYQGPKPLFALDIQAIEEAAEPGHFERCVLNVALHEESHLDEFGVLESPDIPRLREVQTTTFARSWAASKSEKDPERSGHGLTFIRKCCHLFSRAIAGGFDVTPHFLFGMQGWGWLRFTESYLDAIGDEPARLATATFREIEAVEPPAAFTQLWAADLARFQHYQERTID